MYTETELKEALAWLIALQYNHTIDLNEVPKFCQFFREQAAELSRSKDTIKSLGRSFDAMRERATVAEKERDEMQALFDLQHTRTVVADKLWQEAHGKPDVLPDLGELVSWLLRERAALKSAAERKDEALTVIDAAEKALSSPCHCELLKAEDEAPGHYSACYQIAALSAIRQFKESAVKPEKPCEECGGDGMVLRHIPEHLQAVGYFNPPEESHAICPNGCPPAKKGD